MFAPDLLEIHELSCSGSIFLIIEEVVVFPLVPDITMHLRPIESSSRIPGYRRRAMLPGRAVPPLPSDLRI
jgi:hypothetical protein